MMYHLAFFLIKNLGRGCHSDQRGGRGAGGGGGFKNVT